MAQRWIHAPPGSRWGEFGPDVVLMSLQYSTQWDAPAATPADIVKRMEAELVDVLAQPAVRQRLTGLGAQPAGAEARELPAFVRAETGKWATVIKTARIKLD